MRRALIPAIAAAYVLCARGPGFGQINQWPLELGIPVRPPAPDSNRTVYGSDQSLYIRTFKVRDSVNIQENTPLYGVNQNVDYALSNDSWFNTTDQFFDLSGDAMKKGLPLGMSAGLEWTPVLILNKRTSSQGILGSVEAGPLLTFAPLSIPMMIHGGATARGWNDDIGALSANQYGTLSRDKGFYAGAELGSPVHPVPFLPLIVTVKGYGRSMETSKLVSGTASALLYLGMPTGDSLFALYADSLTEGRDAFLGEDQGKPSFIDDPEKTERSYQVSAGFRAKPRLFLVPGAVYSYTEHTLSYPGAWGNKKNTDNAVNLLLRTDTLFFVSYQGGIKVEWEREDMNSASSAGTAGGAILPPQPQTTDFAGNLASLNDYLGYRVAMLNSISKYLQNGMGAEYTWDISRYSKDYPVSYVVNGDTVRQDPPLDNDIIVNRQRFTLVPIPSSWGKGSLFVEYSKNITNYIKAEMSGNNTVDWLYRVGGTAGFTVAQRCTVSEAMTADTKETDYAFPETKRGSPPPYSRKWSSQLLLNLVANRWLTLRTEWNETYSDFGTWNAKEYMDSTAFKTPQEAADYKDYYAITDKTWDHGIKLTVASNILNTCLVNAGCSYEYIDAREFNVADQTYALTYSAGTRVTPFVSLSYELNRQLVFYANFARTFDIKDKYWDIHVSLKGTF